jgi:hypothetical protein
MVQMRLSRTGIDGEQFVHECNDSGCHHVLAIQLHRLEEASPGVRPAGSMHNACSADMVVHGVAIGLQNAFELFEKLLGTLTAAAHAEVEDHRPSGRSILPQIRLMMFTTAVVCLHIDRSFIGLDVGSRK